MSRIIIGEYSVNSGPNGFYPANSLSDNLRDLGFTMQRFKTGTPARIDGNTIDYDKMYVQPGDEEIIPFSFLHDTLTREQIPCWLTYTTEKTHDIIRANLHRAPMYSGCLLYTSCNYPLCLPCLQHLEQSPVHNLRCSMLILRCV